MTANLATALAAFQAEMPTVAKNHRADTEKFSYTYAGLADITEQTMPLLTKHGLSFSACPRQSERGYELVGRLLHSSGDTLEGSLPIAGNSPQEMGSSLTYMRRYLFGCMTGVVTDDDDDGRIAQAAAKKAPAKKTASRGAPNDEPLGPPGEPDPPKWGSHAPMAAKTRGRLFALFTKAGIEDRDEQLRGINHIIGKELTSRGDLTEPDAKKVIARLEERTKDGASA